MSFDQFGNVVEDTQRIQFIKRSLQLKNKSLNSKEKPMGKKEIDESMQKLQVEYNRLCGLNGHLRAQRKAMKDDLRNNEIEISAVLKKVQTLQANTPKETVEETQTEEVKNEAHG